MPAPRDRQIPDPLEIRGTRYPLAPLNATVYSLAKEHVDIRWTHPGELEQNSCFNIIGVNIYRSYDSEYGPFVRLNAAPIGTLFWRDHTIIEQAINEDVSNKFIRRGVVNDPDGRYSFKTKNNPIIIYPSPGAANCTSLNVQVTVNGNPAWVQRIYASEGIVELRTIPAFDVVSQTEIQPVLPLNDNDVVLASYRYKSTETRTRLFQRIFYRITTVATCKDNPVLIETPLERAAKAYRRETEKLDYIWKEAIRRNNWILEQGGERVRLYIRKYMGIQCGCVESTHRHPNFKCPVCFGGGFIGGYEDAGELIMAPDEAERRIGQMYRGLQPTHDYESWTGPSPILSQRDFIVKLSGDRYGIGPVKTTTLRGMQLQQSFTLNYCDETDIIYNIPIFDSTFMEFPETRWLAPGRSRATPMMTEKDNIDNAREYRGNLAVWENIEY